MLARMCGGRRVKGAKPPKKKPAEPVEEPVERTSSSWNPMNWSIFGGDVTEPVKEPVEQQNEPKKKQKTKKKKQHVVRRRQPRPQNLSVTPCRHNIHQPDHSGH